MDNTKTLIRPINLRLFDGAGAASGAGDAGTGTAAVGEGTQGDALGAVPAPARRGKSGENLSNVIYGKQQATDDAQIQPEGQKKSDAGSEKTDPVKDTRQEFADLIKGKYKDAFADETQRIIDRRFKTTKELEAKIATLAPALDILSDHYGITDDADYTRLAAAVSKDNSLLAEAADDAGMTSEQYREFMRLKRENAAIKAARENDVKAEKIRADAQRLKSEGEALKAKYPQFDLKEFISDRDSMAAFVAGQPMENVYWAAHHDDLLAAEVNKAVASTEKNVVSSIRAKGKRPAENGTSSQGAAFVTKSDPSKLSLRDFEEIARRVRNGDIISF